MVYTYSVTSVQETYLIILCSAAVSDDTLQTTVYLEGPVLISRSPVIHPGDVQVVKAVGKPPENSPLALGGLVNCVVFSCEGV